MYTQPELATFPRMLVMVAMKLWCSEHHNNNTPHPAPDFRISIFNHPLYRSTTQGWEPFVAAGLYIKQSLSWNDSRVVVLKCQMVKVELEMLTLSSVHITEKVLGL